MRLFRLALKAIAVCSSLLLVTGYISYRSGLLDQAFASTGSGTFEATGADQIESERTNTPAVAAQSITPMPVLREPVVMSGSKSLVIDHSVSPWFHDNTAAQSFNETTSQVGAAAPSGDDPSAVWNANTPTVSSVSAKLNETEADISRFRVVENVDALTDPTHYSITSPNLHRTKVMSGSKSILLEWLSEATAASTKAQPKQHDTHQCERVVMSGSKSPVLGIRIANSSAATIQVPTHLDGFSFSLPDAASRESAPAEIEPQNPPTDQASNSPTDFQSDLPSESSFQNTDTPSPENATKKPSAPANEPANEYRHERELMAGSKSYSIVWLPRGEPDAIHAYLNEFLEAAFRLTRQRGSNQNSQKVSKPENSNVFCSIRPMGDLSELTDLPEPDLPPLLDTGPFPSEAPTVEPKTDIGTQSNLNLAPNQIRGRVLVLDLDGEILSPSAFDASKLQLVREGVETQSIASSTFNAIVDDHLRGKLFPDEEPKITFDEPIESELFLGSTVDESFLQNEKRIVPPRIFVVMRPFDWRIENDWRRDRIERTWGFHLRRSISTPEPLPPIQVGDDTMTRN